MKKLLFLGLLFCQVQLFAQQDSSMNMDAVYNRPMLQLGNTPVSLGGYLEVNWQHEGVDGVSDGHQMQARRLTLFIGSQIDRRIKFMTEIELEEGGEEINIEFAAADISLHPLLNVRAGIIMNPIGAFNQNHDGPKWEFTDRPMVAKELLGATWSNAGAGLFGKYFLGKHKFAYEAYLSSGYDASIISNDQNKTYLPASKANKERFEEGNLLFTGKVAYGHQKWGEIGLSMMRGQYNRPLEDGLVLDQARFVSAFAMDFNHSSILDITGEVVWVNVDLPANYTPQYGGQQFGYFIDLSKTIYKPSISFWPDARVLLAIRWVQVDWNKGNFEETAKPKGDEISALSTGISFRPSSNTVLRFNYKYFQETDFLSNPPALGAKFSLGLSTYF